MILPTAEGRHTHTVQVILPTAEGRHTHTVQVILPTAEGRHTHTVQVILPTAEGRHTHTINAGKLSRARASGCLVEYLICNREVAGSNLSLGYFAPRSTQPSIPPGR